MAIGGSFEPLIAPSNVVRWSSAKGIQVEGAAHVWFQEVCVAILRSWSSLVRIDALLHRRCAALFGERPDLRLRWRICAESRTVRSSRGDDASSLSDLTLRLWLR